MKKKETGKLIGYARVSTEDQNLQMQIEALEKAGCHNIWQEKRSATRGKRPELENALIDLRPGDTLVVWKLDRLIRNARDASKILDRVEASGATIISLTEPHITIQSPVGEFTFWLAALLAQLEVRTTAQRTAAGIKVITDRGLRFGRAPMLSAKQAAQLVALRKADKRKWTKAALAEKFDVSEATVSNYIKRDRLKRRPKR